MEIKSILKQPYTDKQRMDFIVEQNHNNGYEIKETETSLQAWGYTDEEKSQHEREAKDLLTLTPADVERALYKSKGMDFDDLKALIAEKLPDIDTKALAIEFRAKDFYRGATLSDGTRLFDTVGALLGYTSDDMDYLFENKELPANDSTTDTTTTDIHNEVDTENTDTTAQQTNTNADNSGQSEETANTGSADTAE